MNLHYNLFSEMSTSNKYLLYILYVRHGTPTANLLALRWKYKKRNKEIFLTNIDAILPKCKHLYIDFAVSFI